MSTNPVIRFDLIQRTARVLATLAVLVVGGDVVIGAAAFGTVYGTVGVGGSEFEASGTLLKVNLLFPNAGIDLSGEHDDR